MKIFPTALLLILVMDPLGNIGLFLAALSNVPIERQKKVIRRELLIALAALLGFLFVGRFGLEMLQLSDPALSIAGGILLLLIALRMIFPSPDKPLREEVDNEPFIVPLAIPYVAGPSALATELLLMTREPQRWPEWVLAVVLAWSVASIILYYATSMRKYLGERGLIAVERLMGMILINVSVQMFLRGLSQFLSQQH